MVETPTDDSPQRVGVREFRGNLTGFLRQAERPARRPGALRGNIRIAPDFDHLPADVLAAMEGGGGVKCLLDTHALLRWLADIEEVMDAVQRKGFTMLPVGMAHLVTVAGLPTHHRDPFDHLLIAQAMTEGATFLSGDRNAAQYPVRTVSCLGRKA